MTQGYLGLIHFLCLLQTLIFTLGTILILDGALLLIPTYRHFNKPLPWHTVITTCPHSETFTYHHSDSLPMNVPYLVHHLECLSLVLWELYGFFSGFLNLKNILASVTYKKSYSVSVLFSHAFHYLVFDAVSPFSLRYINISPSHTYQQHSATSNSRDICQFTLDFSFKFRKMVWKLTWVRADPLFISGNKGRSSPVRKSR